MKITGNFKGDLANDHAYRNTYWNLGNHLQRHLVYRENIYGNKHGLYVHMFNQGKKGIYAPTC